MTPTYPSATRNMGRFTALVLSFVVLVCVAMIGGTGYLKYQLDRAQTTLAAPDTATGTDQEMFDRLRRSLGYGGFLGLAQNYAQAHDTAGFAEMKADIKSADDIVAHFPDRTPAEIRHDLTAIVGTFDAAFRRLNAPVNEVPEFTINDLAPLYAAIPILDARISAASVGTHIEAQNKAQYWGMLLTLVNWCSLIIASACAAGIYLALRDKHAVPMRALAQSIQNMARGDMRTAIWGVERQDMIGELARAVDIARYHFSHLPDISVLSDQGPVRMRFEGESRSLFEAMMKAISRDSENIREQASALSSTTSQQKENIDSLSEKVETVLQNILRNGTNGEAQIKQAIHDMTASVESLKNVHAHAADQFNRMLPTLQERVQGLAEIAAITGKQVSQTLQGLTVSEMGLKSSTEQTKSLLARLSSTADDLGERMFGAINLLQAGGRVLTETADKIGGIKQVSANHHHANDDAIELVSLPVTASLSADALEPLNGRLDNFAAQLISLAKKLDSGLQGAAPSSPTVDLSPLAAQWQDEQRMIERALADIQNRIDVLAASAQDKPPVIEAAPSTLLFDIQSLLAREIGNVKTDLGEIGHAIAVEVQSHIDTVATTWQNTLRDAAASDKNVVNEIRHHIQAANDQWERKVSALTQNLPSELRAATDPAFAAVIQKLSLTQNVIEQSLAQQQKTLAAHATHSQNIATQAVTLHTEAQNAMRHVLLDVADKVAAMAQAMPADMQQRMRDQWYQIAAQIESSRASTERLANAVNDKLDTFEQSVAATLRAVEQAKAVIENPPQRAFDMPKELQKQIHDQWFQIVAQIEASRANLTETVTQQIIQLEKRLAEIAPPKNSTRTTSDYGSQQQMEQQTQILSDLVSALGMLDTHVQQIQSEINAKAL